MRISKVHTLIIVATFLSIGCSEQKPDCKSQDHRQSDECTSKAHESFTRSIGPDTPPTNNKKW